MYLLVLVGCEQRVVTLRAAALHSIEDRQGVVGGYERFQALARYVELQFSNVVLARASKQFVIVAFRKARPYGVIEQHPARPQHHLAHFVRRQFHCVVDTFRHEY